MGSVCAVGPVPAASAGPMMMDALSPRGDSDCDAPQPHGHDAEDYTVPRTRYGVHHGRTAYAYAR